MESAEDAVASRTNVKHGGAKLKEANSYIANRREGSASSVSHLMETAFDGLAPKL